MSISVTQPVIYCGEIWHTPRRPALLQCRDADLEVFPTGALCVGPDGTILAVGDASGILRQFPNALIEQSEQALILPGFIDAHLHFPQLDIIGSHGEQLLGWLDNYTYPAESQLDGPKASDLADRFFTELLANGTTTSCIYATSRYEPTEALFVAAKQRGVRAIIGKVSMDRLAPQVLCQKAADDIVANEKLIASWHGHENRLFVAITPRFAPACTHELLAALGSLKKRYPDLYIQTHHAENLDEIALVKSLFPQAANYLDVYAQYGLLDKRTILGHSIHVEPAEVALMQSRGCAVAHCPTSNLFLGSGLMPMDTLVNAGVRVACGTDIGGGTSVSLWQTLNEAYKVQHLRGLSLSPAWLLYLATLGGAEALSLDHVTGCFTVGKKADFQILKPHRSRLLKARWETQRKSGASAAERLFAMIFLADDRLTERVFVNGKELYHQ